MTRSICDIQISTRVERKTGRYPKRPTRYRFAQLFGQCLFVFVGNRAKRRPSHQQQTCKRQRKPEPMSDHRYPSSHTRPSRGSTKPPRARSSRRRKNERIRTGVESRSERKPGFGLAESQAAPEGGGERGATT